MITITHNAKQVAMALRKMMDGLKHEVANHSNIYSALMSEGIESHFTKLARGGDDPTAIGGDVSWSPVRGWLVRQLRGDNLFPILDDSGDMKRSFMVPEASVTRFNQGGALGISYTGGDSLNQQVAREHLEGELVPKRQFVYWDTAMAGNVKQTFSLQWEQIKRKSRSAA